MIKKYNTMLVSVRGMSEPGGLIFCGHEQQQRIGEHVLLGIIMQIYKHSTSKPSQNLHKCKEYTFISLPREDKKLNYFSAIVWYFLSNSNSSG